MPHRTWIITLSLLASMALAQPPATQPAPAMSGKLDTPIQAFNGKDLTGWLWFSADNRSKIAEVWSVKDGVLRTSGQSTGFLKSEKEYGPDYVLTIEYRHITEGGGAFLFGINGPDKFPPRAVRVEGAYKNVGEVVNLGDYNWFVDMERYRAKDRLIRMAESSEKALGEWNTVVIVVDHGNLLVEVNGVRQNLADGMDDVTGRIGLQAEGAEMEFRKIQVTPIVKK